MRFRSGFLLFAPAILLCTGTNAASRPTIYVGVLEDFETGESQPLFAKPHVRVAFDNKGGKWEANFSAPARITWTAVFNGRNVGMVSSKEPQTHNYPADAGIQIITKDTSPAVDTGAKDFWYIPGQAHYRPLLLVSNGNVSDPDNWKPATLSAAERAAGIAEFRKKVVNSERCPEPEQGPVTKVPYPDNLVQTIKAYRSKDGAILFGMTLKDPKENCGGYENANEYDYWFAAAGNQKPRLLGDRMQPLEAADMDNSGKSQWIFHTSRGENEDGYILYWDKFSKSAEFTWTYH